MKNKIRLAGLMSMVAGFNIMEDIENNILAGLKEKQDTDSYVVTEDEAKAKKQLQRERWMRFNKRPKNEK